MELKGTKEQKKQRLVDLVAAIEREDIIDYFLTFVSGKLSSEIRQQDSERKEGGKTNTLNYLEMIIKTLREIRNPDILYCIYIFVLDIAKEDC